MRALTVMHCDSCVHGQSYQGCKIAIDASMAMYQFLIAVRAYNSQGVASTLQDDQGQDTSHILVRASTLLSALNTMISASVVVCFSTKACFVCVCRLKQLLMTMINTSVAAS